MRHGLTRLAWRSNTTSPQRHFCSRVSKEFSLKAMMVNEFNGRVEGGNWSDKDIVIAYVHLFKHYSSFQQNTRSVPGW